MSGAAGRDGPDGVMLALSVRSIRLLCTLGILSGCVAYRPAPQDVQSLSVTAGAAQLDTEALSAEIDRIAPGTSWNGTQWDRLTLLAAALIANPQIAQARAALLRSSAQAHAARVSPGPALTLATEYSREADGSSPWLLGVTSDVPLDFGDRRSGRIAIADIALRTARLDYAQMVWDVRMEMRRALTERLQSKREIEVATELVALRDRQLELTERFVAVGEYSRTELERIRADRARDAERLADAAARNAAAAVALASAVGVDPGSAGLKSLVWTDFDEPTRIAQAEIDQRRTEALLVRNDVLHALAAYDQAENALRTAVASQYPELHIGPGYVWERGVVKIPFDVGLSWPGFDFDHAAIHAAEAGRTEAGRTLEATMAGAKADIAAASGAYAAAWTRFVLVRERLLPTASRLARQADAALAAGVIGRADWIAAQAGLRTTRLDELAALGNVQIAQAALEDALRRPLDGPEFALPSIASSAVE